jgi:hypothetical protein
MDIYKHKGILSVDIDGKRTTLRSVVKEVGLNWNTIRSRYHRGGFRSLEEVLTQEVRSGARAQVVNYKGKNICLHKLSDLKGVPYVTVFRRLKAGASLDEALSPIENASSYLRGGYLSVTVNGKAVAFHIMAAEKALGRKIPKGAVVHHADGNPLNNSNSNLVICQDTEYHCLLHRRKRAYDACGHVNHRRCKYCREWDDPVNLYIYESNSTAYHGDCQNKYKRELYHKNKQSTGRKK